MNVIHEKQHNKSFLKCLEKASASTRGGTHEPGDLFEARETLHHTGRTIYGTACFHFCQLSMAVGRAQGGFNLLGSFRSGFSHVSECRFQKSKIQNVVNAVVRVADKRN